MEILAFNIVLSVPGYTYRDELRMRLFAVDQRLTHCISLCVGHEVLYRVCFL